MKIKKPNREFIYLSPLVECENENAKIIASLVESFMLENINLQIDFIECRVKQIYEELVKNINDRVQNEH